MNQIFAAFFAVIGVLSSMAFAGGHAMKMVKVTPLGSMDGEFCRLDRALIFEDPNGTRILYDAGRTVAGAQDPRLGKIDIVLLSHVHGDHLGDKHIASVNAGTCSKPEFSVSALPHSNTVKIAAAKNATIITGSEMPQFLGNQLKKAGGDAKKSQLVRFGALKEVNDIKITTVPATHSNGLGAGFIGGEMGKILKSASLSAYVGPPTGYVIEFSNGLVVYLSGDTGMTAEQKLLVNEHYGTELAVMNIGDTYTTGPKQAAFVVNEFIKPKSVIASHANEEATKNGKLLNNTRTKLFKELSNPPVHVPLSGNVMSFDGAGVCVKGCS